MPVVPERTAATATVKRESSAEEEHTSHGPPPSPHLRRNSFEPRDSTTARHLYDTRRSGSMPASSRTTLDRGAHCLLNDRLASQCARSAHAADTSRRSRTGLLSSSSGKREPSTSGPSDTHSAPNPDATCLALTCMILTEHTNRQEQPILNAKVVEERREEWYGRMAERLQSLGTELPNNVTWSTELALNGLTPMERFLVDRNDFEVGSKTQTGYGHVGDALSWSDGAGSDQTESDS